ncbi:oxidative stress-induced growth inhibitor 2-like [Clytia hemisphaerica]|uniref:Uncharacterized protein n=1 Tax=Clytia hemisphaerica TaxID=252671 RepID=A0A7M5V5J3_9CNID
MRLEKRLSSDPDTHGRKDYDVAIIGNGPSAIILSYFLSGHWPYYNGKPVDNPVLKERLKYVSMSKSLVLQDLQWLSEGLFDSRTMNPVSILFDHLYHPNADMLTKPESVIEWKYLPENEVRHVVLGFGPPGGSWHNMINSQLTVSLANWLELPGYTFNEWYEQKQLSLGNLPKVPSVGGVHPERTNPYYIGLYYSDYVKYMGLSSFFVDNVYVKSISQSLSNTSQWTVEGVQYTEQQTGETYTVKADNIVMATGAFNNPRKLEIPGEDFTFVHHHFPDFDRLQTHKCPVVVVGCGLVAADAVLYLISRQIPVIHVFRRSPKDPNLVLNQLSSAYADYLKLKSLIQLKSKCEFYTPLPQHRLAEILPNKEVLIEPCGKKGGASFKIHVSRVIIHVGSKPNLDFIKEEHLLREDPEEEFNIKTNCLDTDLLTYECRGRKSLYAMGPLVGDNFIRFVSGGALGITHGLFRNEAENEDV